MFWDGSRWVDETHTVGRHAESRRIGCATGWRPRPCSSSSPPCSSRSWPRPPRRLPGRRLISRLVRRRTSSRPSRRRRRESAIGARGPARTTRTTSATARQVRPGPRRHRHHQVHGHGDLLDRPGRSDPRQGQALPGRASGQDRRHLRASLQACPGPLRGDIREAATRTLTISVTGTAGHPTVAIDAFVVRGKKGLAKGRIVRRRRPRHEPRSQRPGADPPTVAVHADRPPRSRRRRPLRRRRPRRPPRRPRPPRPTADTDADARSDADPEATPTPTPPPHAHAGPTPTPTP